MIIAFTYRRLSKFPEDQLKVFDNSDFIKVEKETDIFNNLFYYFDLLLKKNSLYKLFFLSSR